MNLDKLKTTAGVDVRGKRVLVRCDLNVPVADGRVTDATACSGWSSGLKDLSGRGAKVIVLSHFRAAKGVDPSLSLAPIAAELGRLLGRSVAFAPDCIGEAAVKVVYAMQPGDIAVLENLRFHKGEEKNDAGFAKALASLGDMFVGDAFSCAHRAHASTEGITRLLPSYAGPLLMEEIGALNRSQPAEAADRGSGRRRQGVDQDPGAGDLLARLQADHRRRRRIPSCAHGIAVGKSLCERISPRPRKHHRRGQGARRS
jgi:phosphoglycerate kinase